MPAKFNLYIGITEIELHHFEMLWSKYSVSLPLFPTMLHNLKDAKAATFNTWIRYSNYQQSLILKLNRIFTHSTVHGISLKMQKSIPLEIEEQFLKNVRDREFTFIFSYFLTRNLIIQLEKFLQVNDEYNGHIQSAYYYIEEKDVSTQDGMYILLKKIIQQFINEDLDQNTITYMYHKTLAETLNICKINHLNEYAK